MSGFSFTCPFCNRPTTITNPNYSEIWQHLDIKDSTFGPVGIKIHAITCPNTECNKLYLKVWLAGTIYNSYTGWAEKEVLGTWQLLPESNAKPLPDYIPLPIRLDYNEACKIKDLSPKASATLSRRCLQGMLRDFHKVTPGKLKDEIDEIKQRVDPLVWEGIESVRNVGNIGAHMEKDINQIIEVEPNEAQLLIGLIERLLEEWYISRKRKEDQLAEIKKMTAAKKAAKKTN